MAVGLGIGLAVGVGFRPTPATAQAGVARLAATARVLPALGLLPSEVEAAVRAGLARIGPWPGRADGPADPALPSVPAATVTRRLPGNRRIVELAATGV